MSKMLASRIERLTALLDEKGPMKIVLTRFTLADCTPAPEEPYLPVIVKPEPTPEPTLDGEAQRRIPLLGGRTR
jgi:hypothetical protein